jgi:hypothetical protein
MILCLREEHRNEAIFLFTSRLPNSPLRSFAVITEYSFVRLYQYRRFHRKEQFSLVIPVQLQVLYHMVLRMIQPLLMMADRRVQHRGGFGGSQAHENPPVDCFGWISLPGNCGGVR